MTNQRFLEAIKRLLAADTYARAREAARGRKPDRPAAEKDK
jgi:hypothetical protein